LDRISGFSGFGFEELERGFNGSNGLARIKDDKTTEPFDLNYG